MDTVWTTTNGIANYNSGYGYNAPMPNFDLEPTTGEINVQTEIPTGYNHAPYILNIRTDEWIPGTGEFKGSTYRDVTFFVLPWANNQNPVFQDLDNVQGAKQTDTFNLRVCARDTFKFDVSFDDPDAIDTIFVSSNLEFIADYYHVTQNGINPTTATITAVINKTYDYGFDAIVKATDSHHPMIGQTSKRVHISSVGPMNLQVPACYNTWDTITTSSDSISAWTVLSGDTISSTSFNCLNSGCTSAELHPFNNTVYLVENFMTGGCSFYDTVSVLTDTTILTGQAVDSNGSAIIYSNVYRFQYDAGQDSVYLIDSAQTDALGYFSFVLGIDSFLLKVSPDSAAYPLLFPTYYDGQVVVPNADFIYPDYCDTIDLVHEVLAGSNPGGPGFISGIVSQGAGRGVGDPVQGVVLVLMDNQGTPIMLERTNANGKFKFDGLNHGDYSVYVDQWGIDNGLAPNILLTVEDNEIDSLQFVLYSNRLELVKPSGIKESTAGSISLYPNPTSETLNVVSSSVITQVKLYDQSGRVHGVFHPNAIRFTLDVKSIPNGLYIVETIDATGLTHHDDVVILK